ncbi:MAG: hypothetical protein ACXWP5_05210 [Bdellovibrionota bacterium]
MKQIPGLKLSSTAVRVDLSSTKDGELTASVPIEGTFEANSRTLLIGTKKVPLQEGKSAGTSKFAASVPIEDMEMPLTFRAIDAHGGSEEEEIQIIFPDIAEFRSQARGKPYTFPWRLSAGVGPALVSYQQTAISPSIGFGFGAKLAGALSLAPQFRPPGWEVNGDFLMTFLPSLQGQAAPEWVFFFELDLRGGYAFHFCQDRCQLGLFAGYYYTTMIDQSNAFGFRNMAGPEIFPAFSFQFDEKNRGELYFKFAPVTSSAALTLSNHEIGAGISWVRYLPAIHHSVSVDLDYTNLQGTQAILSVAVHSLILAGKFML